MRISVIGTASGGVGGAIQKGKANLGPAVIPGRPAFAQLGDISIDRHGKAHRPVVVNAINNGRLENIVKVY